MRLYIRVQALVLLQGDNYGFSNYHLEGVLANPCSATDARFTIHKR